MLRHSLAGPKLSSRDGAAESLRQLSRCRLAIRR